MPWATPSILQELTRARFFERKENSMSNESSHYARELLRTAIDLLDDDESLTAVAMISGALDVLDRRAEPVPIRTGMDWRRIVHMPVMANCRSCA